MAIKKVYIGSVGPYQYDDADPIDDVDGDFPGENQRAVTTNAQMLISTAPSVGEEVVRLVDLTGVLLTPVAVANIDNPGAELGTVDSTAGTMILAYEVEANADQFTIYAWDNACGAGVDSPYVEAGLTGFWVAVAGKYTAGNIELRGTVDGIDVAALATAVTNLLIAYFAHVADGDAHHNEVHDVPSHSDVNLAGLANNDLMRWHDPTSRWVAKDIAEVIASQNVAPGNVDSVGRISSATLTIAVVGPTDNLDVSGVNTVFMNCSANNVTIGGFVGGVDGQHLAVVRG